MVRTSDFVTEVSGSTPDLGQVVHTHVPLSPSIINWYRSKAVTVRNVTVDLASHWPHVTDLSDSSVYRLKA